MPATPIIQVNEVRDDGSIVEMVARQMNERLLDDFEADVEHWSEP